VFNEYEVEKHLNDIIDKFCEIKTRNIISMILRENRNLFATKLEKAGQTKFYPVKLKFKEGFLQKKSTSGKFTTLHSARRGGQTN